MITIDISSFIIGTIIGLIIGLALLYIVTFAAGGMWSKGFSEGWHTGCEYGRKTKDTSEHLKEEENNADSD